MSDSSILRASTFTRYLDEDGLETLANRIEEVYVKKGEEGSRPIPATYDEPTALYAHAVGDIIYMNGHFYKVTVAIAVNDAIAVGTNITADTGIDPGTNVMVDKLPGNVARQIMATDVVVDNTGTGLSSTTAQGAIVELDSSKQAITDNSLNTTSKTVPGAINELNASLTLETFAITPYHRADDEYFDMTDDVRVPEIVRIGHLVYVKWDVSMKKTMPAWTNHKIGTYDHSAFGFNFRTPLYCLTNNSVRTPVCFLVANNGVLSADPYQDFGDQGNWCFTGLCHNNIH